MEEFFFFLSGHLDLCYCLVGFVPKKVADPDKDGNRGGCSTLLLRHSITDLVDTKATVRSYFEVDTFPMGQNTKSRRQSGICWRFQDGSSNTEVA